MKYIVDLNLIRQAKQKVSIPVIGSINCVTYEDWTYFTKKIEEAGADGLELNLFLNPADFENKEFEKALTSTIAVKFFQLERSIQSIINLQLTSDIPFIKKINPKPPK